jgi:hypothetical protein
VSNEGDETKLLNAVAHLYLFQYSIVRYTPLSLTSTPFYILDQALVNMGGYEDTKLRDPYIFVKADDFFQGLDSGAGKISQPARVTYKNDDQLLSNGDKNPACSHGAVFRFNDDSLLLIQFVRPKVWQIRFDANNKSGADFTDFNT